MKRPEFLLPATFLGAILIGTVLLVLPPMHNGGVGLLEAFFTATSAVCVTGLVVVDTGTEFTTSGQTVILALIQLGGLGIMTFGILALVLFGRRVALAQEAAVKNVFTAVAAWRVGHLLAAVVLLTFGIELAGYVALLAAGEESWPALFHSISAFCNAGFSLNADSLQRAGIGVRVVVMLLIVAGGLGFTTLIELYRPLSGRRLSLNARVVLRMTVVLIGFGTLAYALLERDWNNALFMSVTTRTAGFDTVPVGSLHGVTLLVMVPLMFIGASPGSTGGGVKTTTAAVVILFARRVLRGRGDVVMNGRTVPDHVIRRAVGVLFFTAAVVFTAVLLLGLFEANAERMLLAHAFEAVSACATVGLSTGITPDLTAASKLVLCATMFIGRVGSLSVFLLLVLRDAPVSRVRYPEERVLIG
ncbi:MAG: TrkH family potassium uptake protein [Planctomycetota bacterium]|jgi:trk system potassium uptake protein TrkH